MYTSLWDNYFAYYRNIKILKKYTYNIPEKCVQLHWMVYFHYFYFILIFLSHVINSASAFKDSDT